MKKLFILLLITAMVLCGCQAGVTDTAPTTEPTSEPTTEPTEMPTSAPTEPPVTEPPRSEEYMLAWQHYDSLWPSKEKSKVQPLTMKTAVYPKMTLAEALEQFGIPYWTYGSSHIPFEISWKLEDGNVLRIWFSSVDDAQFLNRLVAGEFRLSGEISTEDVYRAFLDIERPAYGLVGKYGYTSSVTGEFTYITKNEMKVIKEWMGQCRACEAYVCVDEIQWYPPLEYLFTISHDELFKD